MAGKAATANKRGLSIWVILLIALATALFTMAMIALSSAMAPAGGTEEYMPAALVIHLATALPAILLGGWLLLRRRKGDRLHRLLGRLWTALMLTTSAATFWLTGLTGGLSPIHVFSVITPLSIARAVWAARTGNMQAHRYAMTGAYIGLIVAGGFTLVPSRLLGGLLFG
jgi:uncharacterized membrane protein